MCLLDFALRRNQADGDYAISREEFELLMWKLKMMHADKDEDWALEQPAPKSLTMRQRRMNSPKNFPSRIKLGGLDEGSLAGKFSNRDKADLLRKLQLRRRREHKRWAADVFKKLDMDRSGSLSRLELGTDRFAKYIQECLPKQRLPDTRYSKGLVDFVLGRANNFGDDHVSKAEFEEFTWKMKNMQSDIDFETEFMFALFDPDRNGQIDHEEFRLLFNFQSQGGRHNSSEEYIKKIMKELDEDGDGLISKQEYMRWSSRQSSAHSSMETLDRSFAEGSQSSQEMVLVPPEINRQTHKRLIASKFAVLDKKGAGRISRKELRSKTFMEILQGTTTGHVDIDTILPLVDCLLCKDSADGNDDISATEFEEFMWKLKKLDAGSPRPDTELRNSPSASSLLSDEHGESPGSRPLHA
jgi:Ca2+-binding EF-hand superfamily protein